MNEHVHRQHSYQKIQSNNDCELYGGQVILIYFYLREINYHWRISVITKRCLGFVLSHVCISRVRSEPDGRPAHFPDNLSLICLVFCKQELYH